MHTSAALAIDGEIHAYLLTPDQNASPAPIRLHIDGDEQPLAPINTAVSNGRQSDSSRPQPILENAQSPRTQHPSVARPVSVLAGLAKETLGAPPFAVPLEDPLQMTGYVSG
jgi:hypothetical protein